ncbi:MAG: hypothetical protein NW217_06955 [Hyphomicrobiaceae bacterium]|nr:hypothetical protein [Hyphomicrobiaceae bacterium]
MNNSCRAAKYWVLGAALIASGSGSVTADTARGCLRDWSQAAAVVAHEGLTNVADLTKLVEQNGTGRIVQAMLCKVGDRHVYRLVVREGAGRLVTMTVDARRPFGEVPVAGQRPDKKPAIGASVLP